MPYMTEREMITKLLYNMDDAFAKITIMALIKRHFTLTENENNLDETEKAELVTISKYLMKCNIDYLIDSDDEIHLKST